MNEKEIDYNLLEVEKGNKRNGIYLKNHIQDQANRIKRLYEKNKYLEEDFKRHIDRINELTNRIDKAIEYIEKNQNTDLSVDCYYKLKDIIEFDELLDILKGSDKE